MVKVTKAKKVANGVVAYGSVSSSTEKSRVYSVIKKVVYTCDCPDFTFRGKECKHIMAFKAKEK